MKISRGWFLSALSSATHPNREFPFTLGCPKGKYQDAFQPSASCKGAKNRLFAEKGCGIVMSRVDSIDFLAENHLRLASSQISQTLSVALLADCLVGEFQDVVGQTECKRKRSHLVVCGRLATVALIHISNPCVQSLRCKYIRGRACSSILQTYVSCPGGASRRLPLRPIDLPTPCTFYDSAPSLSAGL